MRLNEFLFFYFLVGIFLTVLIVMFPQEYMNSLSRVLLIIKTFSLKRKHQQSNTPLPPVKQEQEKYLKQMNEDVQNEMVNTQKSSFRFNVNLIKLLIGWPLILFLYAFAVIIKIFNLDDPDLP